MKRNRTTPLLTLAAVLICFALIGLPWQSSSPFGNFSGKLVYNTSDGKLDLNGRYNLFNCHQESFDQSEVKVKILWDGQVQEMDVDSELGTFTTHLKLAGPPSGEVVTLLEIDGNVVAKGTIHLPASLQNRVHIIRFSSAS